MRETETITFLLHVQFLDFLMCSYKEYFFLTIQRLKDLDRQIKVHFGGQLHALGKQCSH